MKPPARSPFDGARAAAANPGYQDDLPTRRRRGAIARSLFLFSAIAGLLVLGSLLWKVIDQSAGFVLRTQGSAPQIAASWNLGESLLEARRIRANAAWEHPEARLEFSWWLNLDLLTSPPSSNPLQAGVRTAILGSIWTIGIAVLAAFPAGVAAAIYLEEFAPDRWITRALQANIHNLAGVPSIIYGMLGLAVFVRSLTAITSGSIFGYGEGSAANGRTVLSAGLTLALLILPLVIINAREALRAVPLSLREASYALGATRWQTVWHHVLPAAMPGVLTGTILATSRAIGETAPLVVVGASTYITLDPESPFSRFTTLPIQIYQWTSRPQAAYHHLAAAAILVLLALLLGLNAFAIWLRNRYSARP